LIGGPEGNRGAAKARIWVSPVFIEPAHEWYGDSCSAVDRGKSLAVDFLVGGIMVVNSWRVDTNGVPDFCQKPEFS